MNNASLYIQTHLTKDYAALYAVSRTNDLDYTLREALRRQVRALRRSVQLKCKADTADKLADKLVRHGNAGAWAKHQLTVLSRPIYNSKAPDRSDLGQWVSVELEVILKSRSAEKIFVSFCRANGYAKHVTIKDDGSVHPTRDCGCEEDEECECSSSYGKEIVVSFKYGDWALLQAICTKLIELGTAVNKTCGLHVHFDCRNSSARQVTTMGQRLARCVPALKQLLPKSRQNNTYCSATINGHRKGNRYAFVNLQSFSKHQTLEVRGHSGTVDADKIVNWIRLLKKIMQQRNTADIAEVSGLISTFRLESDLAQYVLQRFAKFQTVVAPASGDDAADDVASDQDSAA